MYIIAYTNASGCLVEKNDPDWGGTLKKEEAHHFTLEEAKNLLSKTGKVEGIYFCYSEVCIRDTLALGVVVKNRKNTCEQYYELIPVDAIKNIQNEDMFE